MSLELCPFHNSITLAAYMSHIAYDVFVDTKAIFPLLAPFNFNDVFIPHIYALPIEVAAILLVYFLVRALSAKVPFRIHQPVNVFLKFRGQEEGHRTAEFCS